MHAVAGRLWILGCFDRFIDQKNAISSLSVYVLYVCMPSVCAGAVPRLDQHHHHVVRPDTPRVDLYPVWPRDAQQKRNGCACNSVSTYRLGMFVPMLIFLIF
jgi:hypothetical protein